MKPPTHPESDLSIPKTTRNGHKIVENLPDLSLVKWWEKLHDTHLNRLIQLALLNNNQIHIGKANILQAQAQLKAAHFAWLPTLGGSGAGLVGGGWNSQVTPEGPFSQFGALSRTGTIHFNGYNTGFVPTYSFNALANIENSKLAKATLGMQQANYQSIRLSVISQITGSYFMLLGQKQQLKEQSQIITDLKALRQLEEVRYKRGASDLTAVTNLDGQIVTNQASLASIENSIAQVENAIQVLINRNPGPILAHRSVDSLRVRGLIPAQIPSVVLKNRPDMMTAQYQLKIAESNVGVAYSNFFPSISLTGTFGKASFELSHLLKLSTVLWVAEAVASVPLLNGMSYEQIQSAKAGYAASYFSYVQTVRLVFADVDNRLTNQQKMTDIYENKYKAWRVAERNYKLVLARYKAGAKDYREVANTKLNVDSAKLDLTLAKMQQLDGLVEVYQALGGGCRVRYKKEYCFLH